MRSSRSARHSRTAEVWRSFCRPGIVLYGISGDDIAQVGVLNGRSQEGRTGEVRSVQVRSGEVRSGEVRSSEVRPKQRGTGEDGSRKVGTPK